MQSLGVSASAASLFEEHLSPNLPIKVITEPAMKYFKQAEMHFLEFSVCFAVCIHTCFPPQLETFL